MSQKRADTLINAAKQNIGSETDEQMAMVMKSSAEQIMHLKTLVEQHKQYLIKHCDLPEVQLLITLPGIGIVRSACF